MDILLFIDVTDTLEHVFEDSFNLNWRQCNFFIYFFRESCLVFFLNQISLISFDKNLGNIDDVFFFSQILQDFLIVLDVIHHLKLLNDIVIEHFGQPKLSCFLITGIVKRVNLIGLDGFSN